MKKVLLFLLAGLCTANIIGATAFAAELPEDISGSDVVMTPQTEEVEWIFRDYYGVIQKRLWSITYGVWLTDWMDVG